MIHIFHIFRNRASLPTSYGLDIGYGTFLKGMRAKASH